MILDYKYMFTLPDYMKSFIKDFKKVFGNEEVQENS